MKKTMLLTCPAMIPLKYQEILKDSFNVLTAGCALDEKELIESMRGVEIVVIGGAELYTLNVISAEKLPLKAIFIGNQWETSFPGTAAEKIGTENIFVTGGGLTEVARTTFEEIANPRLRKVMITQKSKNFRWTDAPEIAGDSRALEELTISVIGAGNIGANVLRMLEGKCRKLMYHDPFGENKNLTSEAISWQPDLAEAFDADVVTLHLRLGEKTEKIIRKEHLLKIHPEGWFINNSRAELVSTDDFLCFLEKGGQAIWDVFYLEGIRYEELMPRKGVLSNIALSPGFYFTSHTAALSPETFNEYGEGLLRVIRENNLAE